MLKLRQSIQKNYKFHPAANIVSRLKQSLRILFDGLMIKTARKAKTDADHDARQ